MLTAGMSHFDPERTSGSAIPVEIVSQITLLRRLPAILAGCRIPNHRPTFGCYRCHFPRMIERSRCPKCEIRMMQVGVERCLLVPICARLNVLSADWPTRRWQRTNETENKAGWLKSELGQSE
jgi:hypothetical protein